MAEFKLFFGMVGEDGLDMMNRSVDEADVDNAIKKIVEVIDDRFVVGRNKDEDVNRDLTAD